MNAKDKSNMMRAIAQKLEREKMKGQNSQSRKWKTIKQCIDEFKGAADTFDFYAGLTDKIKQNDTF